MVHQHQSSKQYSPVRLGEIISLRHFTPSKSANPFAPKDDSKTRLILDESGTFTKASRQVPEPQKLVTMLDAIEAIKWALMFARWCDEHDASVWAEFWQNLCRDYPSRTPQVRAFFDKAFLHVTLQMRASKSFSEASAEVRSWPKQDELNRPAPSENTEPRRTKGDFGQKGDHKGYKGKAFDSWKGFETGKGKGFLRPWQPRPYRPAAQFSQPRPQCRLFAQKATVSLVRLASSPTETRHRVSKPRLRASRQLFQQPRSCRGPVFRDSAARCLPRQREPTVCRKGRRHNPLRPLRSLRCQV